MYKLSIRRQFFNKYCLFVKMTGDVERKRLKIVQRGILWRKPLSTTDTFFMV